MRWRETDETLKMEGEKVLMMSGEDMDRNFILYELRNYALSQRLVDSLITEKDYVIECLYDDCVPATRFYDPDRDQWLKNGVNTEDMALEIIETKELYDKKIERYQKKANLFNQAMESLTDIEQQAIKSCYLHEGKHLGLSDDAFNRLLHEAEGKLVNFIYEWRKEQQRKEKAAHKELLIEQVKQFKGVM
jgi:hypothetical protein